MLVVRCLCFVLSLTNNEGMEKEENAERKRGEDNKNLKSSMKLGWYGTIAL